MPGKRTPGKLTPLEAKFVAHYLALGNGPEALRAAGTARTGTSNNVRQQAHHMLKRPLVAAAVAAGQAETVRETKITKAWIVEKAVEKLGTTEGAAYFRGLELLARIHGHIIEKRDVRQVKRFDDLSDEELAALASEAQSGEDTRH